MSRLLCACLLLLGTASAKPLHSGPEKIIERTQAIVAGTVVQVKDGSALTIQRVLWDPKGRFKNTRSLPVRTGRLEEGIDLTVGRIAVVLIDDTGRPAFAAEPRVASVDDIDAHPLELRGFYAYNAHLTTPAVVSVKGLLAGVQRGRFEDTLQVELAADFNGPAMPLAQGKLINGKPEIKGVDARLSPWDYELALGQDAQAYRGRFVAVRAGKLVARVLPQGLVAPDLATVKAWRAGQKPATTLTVTLGGAQAQLRFTGPTTGELSAGLWPVAGPTTGTAAVAAIVRQTKSGHRSQTNQLGEGEPPGNGWHIGLRASAGMLWITLPVDVIDARIPLEWRESLTPQTMLLQALRAGPVPARFSGLRTGAGELRMP